jgi:segregation and condensation protein B
MDEAVASMEPTVVSEETPLGPDEIAPADDQTTDATQAPTPEIDAEVTTQQIIEAILFAADTPLTIPKMVSLLGIGSARDVKKHIESLNERYEKEQAAFRIEKIAGGYQLLTMPQFNTWLRRFKQSKQDNRLSPAALETLAVVAYKQPVVRAEIEAIRGVAAGEMLNRLRELGLVKIVGRAEDVGRPMLYGTTKRFLEVFGLSDLQDLPSVEQLQPPT